MMSSNALVRKLRFFLLERGDDDDEMDKGAGFMNLCGS